MDRHPIPKLSEACEITWSGVGKGPRPRIPFSDWRCTVMVGGMKFDANMGIPMPRFAYLDDKFQIQERCVQLFKLLFGLTSRPWTRKLPAWQSSPSSSPLGSTPCCSLMSEQGRLRKTKVEARSPEREWFFQFSSHSWDPEQLSAHRWRAGEPEVKNKIRRRLWFLKQSFSNHLIRRDLSHLNHLLDLSDGDLGCLGHRQVEVVGGHPEDQVAGLVRFPGLDQCKVPGDTFLHDIVPPVEHSLFPG